MNSASHSFFPFLFGLPWLEAAADRFDPAAWEEDD